MPKAVAYFEWLIYEIHPPFQVSYLQFGLKMGAIISLTLHSYRRINYRFSANLSKLINLILYLQEFIVMMIYQKVPIISLQGAIVFLGGSVLRYSEYFHI